MERIPQSYIPDNTAPVQDLAIGDDFIPCIRDDLTSTLTPPLQQSTWALSPKALTNGTWDIYSFSSCDFRDSIRFPEIDVCLAHDSGMLLAPWQSIHPYTPMTKRKSCKGYYYLFCSKHLWRLLLSLGGNCVILVQPLGPWRQDVPLPNTFYLPHVTFHHDYLPCLWPWQQHHLFPLVINKKSLTFIDLQVIPLQQCKCWICNLDPKAEPRYCHKRYVTHIFDTLYNSTMKLVEPLNISSLFSWLLSYKPGTCLWDQPTRTLYTCFPPFYSQNKKFFSMLFRVIYVLLSRSPPLLFEPCEYSK